MSDCICGVDLGLDGAVAMLQIGGGAHLWRMPVMPAPKGKGRIYDLAVIASRLHTWAPDHVFIEAAQLKGKSPKTSLQAVAGPARCQALWEMACHCLSYPHTIVPASRWQKAMFAGLGKVKDTKAASITRAKQLYPGVDLKPGLCKKDHDGLSDALLLATYGLRTLGHERSSDGQG